MLPLDGLKPTPDVLLEADQLRSLWPVLVRVAVQIQKAAVLENEQLGSPGRLKLPGLTESTGGVGVGVGVGDGVGLGVGDGVGVGGGGGGGIGVGDGVGVGVGDGVGVGVDVVTISVTATCVFSLPELMVSVAE